MKTKTTEASEVMTENHDAYSRGSDSRSLAVSNSKLSDPMGHVTDRGGLDLVNDTFDENQSYSKNKP